MGPLALWRDTMSALLAPRRLFPITLVCVPLMVAQHHFSFGRPWALILAAAMCLFFVAVGPWSWRWLFPSGQVQGWLPLRITAYGLLGGVPALLGFAVPEVLDLGSSFLTGSINLLVAATLFWVGGWGLARDITLERNAEALAREVERAQLLAIRAHLDPHFLFNTLNAIAEWCREDGATAERAILQLSAILREILGGIQAPSWPLHEELALVAKVWDLHRTRDPSWFTVDWQVPDPAPEVEVPPMLLLPLAENAVKHGPARGHRGTLSLSVQSRGDDLVISLANPGPYAGPRPGGHGLDTVSRRIALSYGDTASLRMEGVDGSTRATVILPRSGPMESR